MALQPPVCCRWTGSPAAWASHPGCSTCCSPGPSPVGDVVSTQLAVNRGCRPHPWKFRQRLSFCICLIAGRKQAAGLCASGLGLSESTSPLHLSVFLTRTLISILCTAPPKLLLTRSPLTTSELFVVFGPLSFAAAFDTHFP